MTVLEDANYPAIITEEHVGLGPRPTTWQRVRDWELPEATIWMSQCQDVRDRNYGMLLIVRPIASLILRLEIELYVDRGQRFPINALDTPFGPLWLSRSPNGVNDIPLMELSYAALTSLSPSNILASLIKMNGERFADVVCHKLDTLQSLVGNVCQYKGVPYHRPVMVVFGDRTFEQNACEGKIINGLMISLWLSKFGDATALDTIAIDA